MSFTQDLFTSRRNIADGNSRLGDEGRIWYDSISNSLRIGDGITPGGKPITTSVTSANIGNLVITGTTIETLGVLEPITIKADTGGDINLVGNIHMHGNSIFYDKAEFYGGILLASPTHSTSNVLIDGTLVTVGTTQTIGNSTVYGTFQANGNIILIGHTSVLGVTTHTGDTVFNGNVDTTGYMTITGPLSMYGESNFTGNTIIDGKLTLNNQLSLTGLGNIKFNDGLIQDTATISYITNSGHITGAYVFAGQRRGLDLTSDATPLNTPNTIVSRGNGGDTAVGNITASTINTTVIGGNNSIAGSMVVYGNLQVLGTTTTVSANLLVVDTKVIIVANSVTSGTQADSAGIQIGNAIVFADFLYDDYQQAWRSNVGLVPKIDETGNVGSDTRRWHTIHSKYGHFYKALYVGPEPANNINALAQFTGNVNDYAEVYAQNINSGNVASTDYIATADNGSGSTNYIDLGINSSTYDNPDYSISSANDGYLYVNGGDLSLGTQTSGKDVVFHTDGTLSENEAGRIHLGRWLLGGAVDDGTNRLQIGDGVRIVGNVNAGNVNAGNVNAFNITSIATSVTTANTAMKGYVDSQDTAITNAWTANAGVQAGQIASTNTAITTANTAMKGYVDAANTIQSGQISSIQSNVTILQGQISSSYGNANVAAYLPTYTGNISANNITVSHRITGGLFAGDGGLLTNIQIASSQIIGTWTPTVAFSSGGTVTYLQQSGEYIKSGRSVSCFFTIQISATAGATGTVRIGNLPVTSATTSSSYSGGGALDNYSFASLPSHITASIPSASSYADLYWHDRAGSNNTMNIMTTAELGTVATLIGRLTYISAS